jgi:hypothetical protein
MTEPTTPPTPTAPTPTVTLQPGTPPAAPTPAPSGDPAPGGAPPGEPVDDEFTSDRQKRRFAELTGRVGLREKERDEARARVEQLLTREAERQAAGSLAVPTDLWFAGATVADLLTEDGSDVDADKVKAVVDQLVAQRPGLRKASTQPLPGGHAPAPPGKPATFAETIQEMTRGRI